MGDLNPTSRNSAATTVMVHPESKTSSIRKTGPSIGEPFMWKDPSRFLHRSAVEFILF
mgnify:CR=1